MRSYIKIYQLIEEEDTGSSRSGLIKDVSHVGLTLAEPHRQQFGAFDGNKVGLTLVSDRFGQKSFTCRKVKV